MGSDEEAFYDSDEEGFYDNISGDRSESEPEAEDDGGVDDSDETPTSRHEKNYTILEEEDIRKLHDDEISTVSNVLSVSRSLACYLLCRNNWSTTAVYDEWFANEEKAKALITIKPVNKRKSGKHQCKICYESVNVKSMLSVNCGHQFCSDCWKTYISISIDDGPGCLTLRCPQHKCESPVGFEIVDSLVCDEKKEKYYKFLLRSYVEGSRKRKWCPGPGCEFAAQFDSGSENCDVLCKCGYKFCWNCKEEGHRPVDCKTVEKWILKNTSEAENTMWILAYTKPCPKCHKAIEKNTGCNHMTCRPPCNHQFCWICLGPWSKHNEYYACNIYKADDDISEDEKSRLNAKRHVERYKHYYERWASNDKSMKKALVDFIKARDEHVQVLGRVQGVAEGQLGFVTEAWGQVAECRRVLKWTYAYGYYLGEVRSESEMAFFGHLQGEAEWALEKLHDCTENEMGKHVKAECASPDFGEFRQKLTGLISVTKNYFENLVRALENKSFESK